VLDKFDLKKQPTYYKDKKLSMALIAMSGIQPQSTPSLADLQDIRDKLVSVRDRLLINGTLLPNSSKELEFKVAINKVTKAIQNASISGVDPYSSVRQYGSVGEYDEIGKIDFNALFKSIVETAPAIVSSAKRSGGGGINQSYQLPDQTTPNSGINTNTLLLLGAGGLLLYFIVKK